MSIDEMRARSHDIWEEMAAGWDERSDYLWETSRRIGEWMVEKVSPKPGDTILELAAGPGHTGFAAAKLIGDEGRLICTDFSSNMLDVARAMAARLELTNVEFREMDAENIDLEDESVDAILCRWGYMLMMDPARALRESHRVLKTSGRLALSVWGTAAQNPWASLAGMVMVSMGKIPIPDPHAPGSIFSMGEPEKVESMLAEAGFAQTQVELLDVVWRFGGPEELWTFYRDIAGAISIMLRDMDPDTVEAVRAGVLEQAEIFRTGEGYSMPGVTVNAVAIR